MHPDLLDRTVLVIPCYNEESRLRYEYFNSLIELVDDLHLVFVDDGSSDDTAAVLRSIAGDLPQTTILNLSRNFGKANAVRLGMLSSLAISPPPTLIGYLDCDGAFEPEQVARIIELASQTHRSTGCMLVTFPRRPSSHVGSGQLRWIAGRTVQRLLSIGVGGPRNRDWQTGFKLYAASDSLHRALTRPFKSRWFPDVELLARLPKEIVVVQPGIHGLRHAGKSTLRVSAAPVIFGDLIKVKRIQWFKNSRD